MEIPHKQMKVYRYTTNGEGVFSAGKRLLPEDLVDEALQNRSWLPKPALPDGKYRFYLTAKGKERYESTLLHTHKKYLGNIKLEEKVIQDVSSIMYSDEWQVVERVG